MTETDRSARASRAARNVLRTVVIAGAMLAVPTVGCGGSNASTDNTASPAPAGGEASPAPASPAPEGSPAPSAESTPATGTTEVAAASPAPEASPAPVEPTPAPATTSGRRRSRVNSAPVGRGFILG